MQPPPLPPLLAENSISSFFLSSSHIPPSLSLFYTLWKSCVRQWSSAIDEEQRVVGGGGRHSEGRERAREREREMEGRKDNVTSPCHQIEFTPELSG